jgi:mevalonate kinase
MPKAHASAPGKVILLGEHAVVYGEPCVSLALERRIRVWAETGARATTVNGETLDEHRHGYIRTALRLHWNEGPLQVRTVSELPPGGHVGSSAALSVATVAVILRLRDGRDPRPAHVARGAFETELATQGAASPNDTTVSTAGGAVLLSPEPAPGAEHLWSVDKNGRTWHAHRLPPTPLPLVVAHSGVRARTGDQVAKVRALVERDAAARDAVQEIGRLVHDSVDALARRDLRRLGDLMDRDHELLVRLGASHPVLEHLRDAARRVPGTLGAKLTGAGGGGSLIVLTDDVDAVLHTLRAEGVHAYAAAPAPHGLEVGA